MEISNESTRRPTDVEEIHCVRTHAGEFGALVFACVPTLGSRYNIADGAATKTTCSKRQRLIKAVVQFRPFAAIHQLLDRSSVNIRWRPSKQHLNVLRSGLSQVSISHCVLDFRI